MAKKRLNTPGKRKRSSYFPIKVPINTLSGGVGKQAPTKRLPTEAEDLNNVFCTSERSVDKRNGFAMMNGAENLGIANAGNRDIWWYWFLAGRDREFLIGVDKKGLVNDETGEQDMLFVYKKDGQGLIKQAVDNELDEDIVDYIKHGGSSAFESLRACTVGSSVVLLNTEVKAGFTSDGTDNSTFDLDGNKKENEVDEDVAGRKIEYLTSVGVDPDNTAEYWNSSYNYTFGQTAID